MKQLSLRFFAAFALVAFALAPWRCAMAQPDFSALPGAQAFSEQLLDSLRSAWSRLPANESPRTRHLRDDGTPKYANRLILQDSPYLRQHAHNPVNWHAWGDEAFAEAKRRDVPVLISIGYSTCYWCHVMEHESYDDAQVAALINERMLAIKVDRETHPEVDDLYITAVEVMGGYGGWPLNVFATPDGKPFFAGTYFPKGQFHELIRQVSDLWSQSRPDILGLADQISAAVGDYANLHIPDATVEFSEIQRVIEQSAEYQRQADDFELTGNQFPSEAELFLLADTAVRYGDAQAASLLQKRLAAMALGGIRDHVGGGFHRYSIDRDWLVPHFEKMLYNQAHLGRLYLYGYEISGTPMFRRVAVQILDFVLADMTSPHGAFYSALDAGEPGAEGEYYVLDVDEIRPLLPAQGAQQLLDVYGVTEQGNFEGMNILHLPVEPESYAQANGISVSHLLGRMSELTAALAQYRKQRAPPFLDTKIIGAWNGMMIATLAEATEITNDARYLDAAETAAGFIWDRMVDESGMMKRIFIRDRATVEGKLDDYAYFAQALLALYRETGRSIWLERGKLIVDRMLELFWDSGNGGLFTVTAESASGLIARAKEHIDGAVPSGNSVAVEVLSDLYRATGLGIYQDRAQQAVAAFAGEIVQFPINFAYMLKAMQNQLHGNAGPSDYSAHGHIKVALKHARLQSDRISADIALDIDDGWHINSDAPLSDNLIPTAVRVSDGWQVSSLHYPQPNMLGTKFLDQPMAVFDGEISIPVELEREDGDGVPVVSVQLQACDDTGQCLLPETVALELPQALRSAAN